MLTFEGMRSGEEMSELACFGIREGSLMLPFWRVYSKYKVTSSFGWAQAVVTSTAASGPPFFGDLEKRSTVIG